MPVVWYLEREKIKEGLTGDINNQGNIETQKRYRRPRNQAVFKTQKGPDIDYIRTRREERVRYENRYFINQRNTLNYPGIYKA